MTAIPTANHADRRAVRVSRRRIPPFLALSAFLVPLASCRDAGRDAPTFRTPGRCNCLIVTLDTTRADRLGCYGYAKARTPHLDSLAASGVRFLNAYANLPITLPSHISLMTGTFPPEHGVRVNESAALGPGLPTLAEIFHAHGYRTAAFVASVVLDSRFGLGRGFDAYDQVPPTSTHAERRADAVTDAALKWLADADLRPFFAWVHYYDPHNPYEPPPGYAPPGADPYDGEIAFVDAQLGRLLRFLDERTLREKTLILVVGDHGESLGEHDFQFHALLVYDSILRVPLILSLPRTLPSGRLVRGIAEMPDAMPTVLGLLGWPAPSTVRGRSLASAIAGREDLQHPSYGESEYPFLTFGWAPLRSLTTLDWKLIEAPRPELYRRNSDPGEFHNVIDDFPSIADRLRDQLADIERGFVRRSAAPVSLDPQTAERLRSLGYVQTANVAPASRPASLRNPRDMIPVQNAYHAARALAEQGQLDAAARTLAPAVAQSPESIVIRVLLADIFRQLGRLREAEQQCRAALAVNPAADAAIEGLADIAAEFARTGQAEAARRLTEETAQAALAAGRSDLAARIRPRSPTTRKVAP